MSLEILLTQLEASGLVSVCLCSRGSDPGRHRLLAVPLVILMPKLPPFGRLLGLGLS